MSVSRDFIDSCSPEAPARAPHRTRRGRSPLGELTQASAQCGGTMLVFGFHATLGFAQRFDILVQDWLPLPLPLETALPDWAGHRSPRRRLAGRRGLLRIPRRFLTSCLPASLIIRSPLWDVRGPVVRPGRRGRNLWIDYSRLLKSDMR